MYCTNIVFSQTFVVGSESFHLYIDRNEAVVVGVARWTETGVVVELLHTRSSVLTRVTAAWEQAYLAVLTLKHTRQIRTMTFYCSVYTLATEL